jgi:hypothetical protein
MRAFNSPEGIALGSFIISARDRQEPPPILFLGAGCSISAGIPGAKDLLEKASSQVHRQLESLRNSQTTHHVPAQI